MLLEPGACSRARSGADDGYSDGASAVAVDAAGRHQTAGCVDHILSSAQLFAEGDDPASADYGPRPLPIYDRESCC